MALRKEKTPEQLANKSNGQKFPEKLFAQWDNLGSNDDPYILTGHDAESMVGGPNSDPVYIAEYALVRVMKAKSELTITFE